jgi:hypothetical protein
MKSFKCHLCIEQSIYLCLLTAKESINCVTFHIMKYKAQKKQLKEEAVCQQKRKVLKLPSFNKFVNTLPR